VTFLPPSTRWSGDKTGSRDDRMKLLHLCLQEATEPLRRVMLPGLVFRDTDGRLRKMHLCLVNWDTDVPEGKDIASCLHGNITARPCTGCLAEAKEQSLCVAGSVNWRSFEGMQNARDQSAKMHRNADTLRGSIAVRQIRNEAMELLGSLSLASVPPFIRRWPFVDGNVHLLLDFHRCFGFERMHNLHLGVGRTICSVISERLAEGDSVSTQLVASRGEPRKFASIRVAVLSATNNLLALTQSTSPMPGARMDFSTAKSSEKLDSLWTKTGLVGMLQAKDMRSVTTVLPFIAALVDRMCGEEAVAPTTRVVAVYTNLCNKITGCYVEGGSGSTLDGFTMACLERWKTTLLPSSPKL
jgi:Plavaka transposase